MHTARILPALLLSITSHAISAQEPASAQEAPADTIAARELKEVVVEGERIIHKPGCDILLLSDQNRKFGVNALEAISSINYFKTAIGDHDLTSYDGRSVLITINGVPATGYDLCTYSADEIKSVQYYAVTPPEFMSETDGPVINVITRKPRKHMVSGYFDLANAVSTLSGRNYGNLTYADSLNRVQANYRIGYNNFGDVEENSIFRYAPDHVAQYAKTGKLISTWHELNLTYQRDQGPHMFNATLSGIYEHSDEHSEGTADIVEGDVTADGTSRDIAKANAKQLALNLYYRLQLGGGRTFAFTVANTLGQSGSDAALSRYVAPPYDALNYDVSSITDNSTYALGAAAVFMMPLPNGQFSASARYGYTRLRQTAIGNTTHPSTHNAYAFAQYVWMKGGFYIIPSLGLSAIRDCLPVGNNNTIAPLVMFDASWRAPKGLLYGWSTRLSYSMPTYTTTLGNMTDSYTYIDNGLIAAGNPGLKPNRAHRGTLSVDYMSPDGRNSFRVSTSPFYAHNPMEWTLTDIDGIMVRRMENIRYTYSNGFSMSAAWHVLPWLELAPYLDYSYGRDVMYDRRVSFSQWRLGGGLTVSKGHFEASASFNPPIKRINGDFFKRESTQAVGRLRYKLNNFSVTCYYRHFSQNNYTIGRSADFSYKVDTSRKTFNHYVEIGLTYSFSKGKQMQHDDPMLYESSNETGLGSFNGIVK
ncbi:MAG: outer membrane beta-barrel protein [Muribaculaceae bacterium]|nr:outer membrane beta-barrel protein [Muribaculaceae bacterium]